VAEERRRGGRAPAHAHRPAAPGARPEFLALPVIAVQADVAEVGVHPFAVGDRRLRGVAVLEVDRSRGLALEGLALPQQLAATGVEAVDQPAVFALLHRPLEVTDV